MQKLPVGHRVYWYPAPPAADEQPTLAFVTRCNEQGVASLSYLAENSYTFQCRRGVRHKDDPHLVERPNVVQECGVWDWGPDGRPREEKAELPDRSPEEITEKLLELHEKYGKRSAQIAVEMTQFTGERWAHQRVNLALHRLAHQES